MKPIRGRGVVPPLDLIVLVVGSIVLAVPFLVLHHVNTVDGPAHVLGAELVGKLRNVTIVRHYYDLSFIVVPNLLTQYGLAALTWIFSPTWAEKVMVSGYIVGFPLAVRFAIRSVDDTAGWLALVVLPLDVNHMFLMGFYDFSYGMIGAVVAIGLALRARKRWGVGNTIGLAVVLTLTYAAHLVPLVMALVVIGTITLIDVVVELRSSDSADEALRRMVRIALPPLLAMVPVLLLAAAFVASGKGGGLLTRYAEIGSLITGIVTLALPVVSYSNAEAAIGVLTVAVLGALTVKAFRARVNAPPSGTRIALVGAVAVCAVVYFVAPADLGSGTALNSRVSLFIPLVLLLVCASVPVPARIWRNAGLVGLVGTLVLVGMRLPTQVHDDRLVTEYLTVERAIPPGATLLAVRLKGMGWLDPLTHESSRVAAERGDVDLLDFEGFEPYFQARFRPHFKRIAVEDLETKKVHLAAYERAGGRVDYVLVVGRRQSSPLVRGAPDTVFLEQELARDYVRIMVTRPTGLVELYRHR